MELFDDVYKLIRAFIDFKDLPEGCAVNGVKCLCGGQQRRHTMAVAICCLLLELAQSEDQVRSGTASPESTLSFRENFFRNDL